MRKILFLFLSILLVFQSVSGDEQKLNQAYEYQVLERVKDIFSVGALQVMSEHPLCGTPIFVELNHNRSRFSARTAALLEPLISRPDFGGEQEYTYDTPKGNIKLHYAKTGTDAIFQANVDVNPLDGVPDYVNLCGDIFDWVWAKEVDSLGYNPPPSDNWYQSNGGDGKFDVYLKNISPSYYGYTEPESSISGSSQSYTSYIVIRNDYNGKCFGHDDPYDCLRVTAAHEFFHAIQFGYDASEFEFTDQNDQNTFKPYWMEMSSTWMENIVYNSINDYLFYLPSFFRHPDWSLKTFSYYTVISDSALHAYGACVWPIYLAERKYPSDSTGFDVSIIRDIWTECGRVPGSNAIDYPNGLSATDIALQARGITFEEAFRGFSVWNYFTGGRDRTSTFYSEGNLFPEVKADTHTTYPVDETSPGLIRNLGSAYHIFIPIPGSEGGLKMDFDGHSADFSHMVSVLGYQPKPRLPFDTTMFLNPFNMTGSFKFYDWNIYNEVVLIPAVIKRNPNTGWSYAYSAVYDSTLQGEFILPNKDDVLQNYPNPFVIKTETDTTYFPFVLSNSTHVRIDIFNTSGERIRSLIPQNDPKYPVGEYIDRIYAIPWDGKNEAGETVSAGIYIYKFQTEKFTVLKKLAVVR
jgi:hypothetical protein